jgi:hypothetical protein
MFRKRLEMLHVSEGLSGVMHGWMNPAPTITLIPLSGIDTSGETCVTLSQEKSHMKYVASSPPGDHKIHC